MAVFLCLISLLLCSTLVVTSEIRCVCPENVTSVHPDYYWRDYNGNIPSDAVKGGYDEFGNVTYIGQGIEKDHDLVVPGAISPGKLELDAPLIILTSYIRVLCSQHVHLFEWKDTNMNDLHLLIDFILVVGGMEHGYPSYIGRMNFDGKVLVGKVVTLPRFKGLRVRARNGDQEVFQSFQILTYAR